VLIVGTYSWRLCGIGDAASKKGPRVKKQSQEQSLANPGCGGRRDSSAGPDSADVRNRIEDAQEGGDPRLTGRNYVSITKLVMDSNTAAGRYGKLQPGDLKDSLTVWLEHVTRDVVVRR
jgi:hypothetical protein